MLSEGIQALDKVGGGGLELIAAALETLTLRFS